MNKDQIKKFISKTIADYNLIADKFSSTRSNLSQDLVDLAKLAGDNDKILDYGCGNGRFCQMFNPSQYLGVDPSIKLINIAKSKFPNYQFFYIKPCEFPEKDQFDVIFCLSMIHHLPNRESQHKLICDFYNRLKPGGIVVVTAWRLEQNNISETKISRVPFHSDAEIIIREIYTFAKEELCNLVNECGFTILSSKIKPRNSGKYSNIEIVAQKTIS